MMTQDDDFQGTTYIDHGDGHQHDDSADTEQASDAAAQSFAPITDEELSGESQPSPSEKPEGDTKSDAPQAHESEAAETLEERVEKLESELAAYEKQTDKKLKSVEKLAKKPHLSPEERMYRIQEDA